MSALGPKKNDFLNLRKAAEKKLKPMVVKQKNVLVSELKHKLSVHKVELEMQNEELLNTQVKLLKSIEEYTELFESSPVGYFILDKNGVILKVNETGCNYLGANKNQLTKKHLSVFLNSKSCQDDFYRHRNLVIESEKKLQFECKIKRSDGSIFFGLIETSIVKDEKGEFKFMLSTVSDITKQKTQEKVLASALKKEKELNKMKSQFITIASHEFRTPLSTILTSAELIEKYNQPEDKSKKERHFEKIKTSVNRLKEILIDFLSASDVEKGKINNDPEIFNLIEFIEKHIKDIKPFDGIHQHKYKHIGQYQNAYLDKKLLKTCLTNLFINAYKYSPKGGLIEITSEQTTPGNITITIKDKGIGIPEKDQVHIFEQFFRAKNAETTQGTGLGLHITQELVTLMGGTISFTSKVNKGSTFIMKFPQKAQ